MMIKIIHCFYICFNFFLLGHLLVQLFAAFVSCWHITFRFTSFIGVSVFCVTNKFDLIDLIRSSRLVKRRTSLFYRLGNHQYSRTLKLTTSQSVRFCDVVLVCIDIRILSEYVPHQPFCTDS